MKQFLLLVIAMLLGASAARAADDPARDREMRDRYESTLLKNPFQDRAFNAVYDSYTQVEGIDQWINALKPKADANTDETLPALLLLGQIYDRQFQSDAAIESLEKAAAKGETRAPFKVLLGTLYYKAGQDDKAAELLSASLDSLSDLDQRASVCRILGNLYLRQGKRDQAVAVWKRIAEQNPGEVFAELELAEIYQDNRMWDEAIAIHRRIADSSKDDVYRRCRALRAIGECFAQAEKFKDAIASYEQALELVSPGNWLFEDLKSRLVNIYADTGDLAGLVNYLKARLEQTPGDAEFRELLAEAYIRMSKFPEAEKEYRLVLERDTRNSGIYEKLIRLYERMERKDDVIASFEKLIELFPADIDYLRRLGEVHLQQGNPDRAKETWRRLIKTSPTAEQLATLAGWFETHEFPDEAIATYQQALAKTKNKDWTLRLAGLRFQKGEEADAIKLWLGAIDSATSTADDYGEIAGILEGNQKWEQAATLRKAALDKDPQNFEARLAYARLLMRQSRFDEAAAEFETVASKTENEFLQQRAEIGRIEAWREQGVLAAKQKELETAVTANPNDEKQLAQLSRVYERAGQQEKAIALYENRRDRDPGNIEYLRSLAALYKQNKRIDLAVAAYKALLDKDKTRARVYQKSLLDLYLAADLKEEAIAAAEGMVSLASSDPQARMTLGQVHQAYGNSEKAFAEYRYALRLDPNEADYWRQYGSALETARRYGEAQEAYRKMLDTAREDAARMSAITLLTRIYLAQDRFPDLLAEFQRRIRNTPKKLAAYQELAAIHREAGQVSRSVEVLESALQNVDEKPDALKALIRAAGDAEDFPKVRAFFEQLVAMSGKPSANEYERLGRIYADLGEPEKAKDTWNKIIAATPKDAAAFDRVAKLYSERGLAEEALELRRKSVELDPGDYRRRFEYAQALSQNQKPDQAFEQLKLLLQIGDREEQAAAEAGKKLQPIARGQTRGFAPSSSYFGQSTTSASFWRPYTGSWQGSFKQFRISIIQFMATVSQQSIGPDAMIEQFRGPVEKAPDNVEARRDLLMVLGIFNRAEEALKQGEALAALAPNDSDLMQVVALLYSEQGQLDKAAGILERLIQGQSTPAPGLRASLMQLYNKNKQPEKAIAVGEAALKDNPADLSVAFNLNTMLEQADRFDDARRVLTNLATANPTYRDSVNRTLATAAKRKDNMEEAVRLYRDSMLAQPIAPSTGILAAAPQAASVYSPGSNPMFRDNNPISGTIQNAFGGHQSGKILALAELRTLAKSGVESASNVCAEVEQIAASWAPSQPPARRDLDWSIGRVLIGYYLKDKETDKATNLLAQLRRTGMDSMEWFNAALFTAEQREDWDGMLKLYEEIQQRFPAKSRDISLATANAYVQARRYEDVAKAVHDLNRQRVPPARVLELIGALTQTEKKLARELLEEHLAGISRSPQALWMLADLYAEEKDFERAIALGNEAWERRGSGQQSNPMMMMGPGTVMMTGSARSFVINQGTVTIPAVRVGSSPVSTTTSAIRTALVPLQTGSVYYGANAPLQNLYRYYVGARKSDELIKRFEDNLQKQPGSAQAHEQLATLYSISDQKEKAIEIYRQLTAKQPRLLSAYRQIANLYQQLGQLDKATQVYEDLIKANPTLFQSVQMELRSLYQRQGKGKEVQTMESKLVADARDPRQLASLAMRMSGDTPLMVEIWRKAVKLAPGDPQYQSKLANALFEDGQIEEAVKAFDNWFNTPQVRIGTRPDLTALSQYAGVYKALNKLPVLTQRCQEELKKNPADTTTLALLANIAFLEKRYTNAIDGYKKVFNTVPDGNIGNQLYELAGFSGMYNEVLEATGKSLAPSLAGELYLAAGDKQKATVQLGKAADQMLSQGNPYGALQAINLLTRMNLWDEAERIMAKSRNDPVSLMNQTLSLDNTLAAAYVNNNRYQSIVKEALTKNPINDRDLQLIQCIASQYEAQGRRTEERALLENLFATNSQNRKLVLTLLPLYSAPEDLPKRRALTTWLLQGETNNVQYRRLWAETLVQSGDAREAIEKTAAWAEEKPSDQNWMLLADIQELAGQFHDARASLLKAVESTDPLRKNDIEFQVAEFDSIQGDPSTLREAWKTKFEKKRDALAYQSYFATLYRGGWSQEARALCAANSDQNQAGWAMNEEMTRACLEQSDYQTPAQWNWRFARSGSQYYFLVQSEQIVKVYRDRGKLAWLATDLQDRVQQNASNNVVLWRAVAGFWADAGYPSKALEICDQQLQRRPTDVELRQRKADLLLTLGRNDEAIEFLRGAAGNTSLDREMRAQLQLVRALYKANRPEDARREMNAVLAWDKRSSTLRQMADILMEQGDYTGAAPLLQNARNGIRDWAYDDFLISLARCQGRLGNMQAFTNAVAELARAENPDNRLLQLQGWLVSGNLHDAVIRVIQTRLSRRGTDPNLFIALASEQLNAGRTNDAFSTFQEAGRKVSPDQQDLLYSGLGTLLLDRGILEAAFQTAAAGAQPAIALAVLQALNTPAGTNYAHLLNEASNKLPITEPAAQQALGEAFARANRSQEAAAQFKRVLSAPSATSRQRLDAAVALSRISNDPAARPVLREAMDKQPKEFINREECVAAVMKTGDTALTAQLETTLSAAACNDAQRDFYAWRMTWHRGQTNEARSKIAALENAPGLTAPQLETLVRFAGEQHLTKLLLRLAYGGYGPQVRDQAFASLVKAQANEGRIAEAIEILAKWQPEWGSKPAIDAQRALAEAVSTANYNTFKEAALKTIGAQATNDFASDLCGFTSQIAQRLGKTESAAAIATEAHLKDMERDEAAAWDSLIEQWEITGPIGLEFTNTPAVGEPVPAPQIQWIRTDPLRQLGIVEAGPAAPGRFAYARTTIESPADRLVTLGLGSSGPVKIWVNGTLLHNSNRTGSCTLDQTRLITRLKKGPNRILLEIGSGPDTWTFCLRATDGPESVAMASSPKDQK